MIINPMFRFVRVLAFAALFVAEPLFAQSKDIRALAEAGEAAEQGHKAAQCNLGRAYRDGEGVEQSETVKWLRRSAEQGYAEAQTALGIMYYLGRGVEQSYAKAAEWQRKAAEQGHKAAQCNLGSAYRDGEGVEQSDAEAVKWLRRSAEQGYAEAQTALGLMYYQGRGVEQSYAKAAEWHRKAAEQGNADAKEALANSKLAEKWVDARGYTWRYTIVDGEATIVSNESLRCGAGTSAPLGDLIIPAVINGFPVRAIGESAFSGCSGLTSVRIPASVTDIRFGAFYKCNGLTSVKVAADVSCVSEDVLPRGVRILREP